ncbi:MAG: ATP-binding protein [Deltaproteobacteria bacterium]
MTSKMLELELERIDLLASCVTACREGVAPGGELTQRLGTVSRQVVRRRRTSPWCVLAQEYGLSELDQDVLMCVLAPEVEPQLGWIFMRLQPSVRSPHPTPALLRELLFMTGDRGREFSDCFHASGPLVARGLVEVQSDDSFAPVRPTLVAKSGFLGWSAPPLAIPGAVEVRSRARHTLVLPEVCLRLLGEFTLWCTHRETVAGQWGADVGGGPVALFSGAPGTGKTHAASVVAQQLGWPLFRVDLGCLVSKYIGETEKNLNALFQAAHEREVVLLFDEAEALFGRRGEVRDARDRYANMEVGHLLSRIERHVGPCVLTTNNRAALDPAFTRRFQVVLDFPQPGPDERRQLWALHLPPRAPVDAAVCCVELGRAVQMTGAQIKNAATHAAFLAAGELMPIRLRHIALAVWSELAKDGTEMFPSRLGSLADHLPEVTS